ncbi:hypothetical protein [Aestuariivirga sp.]|uniref:hypothetical protein n=1 Tax=Aestuariivirga sp. TaxID=2650926 RepID=UPI0039E67CCD
MEAQDYWDTISEKFAEISASLKYIPIPTQNEIDAYKISQNYPSLFTSVLREKRKAGHPLFPPAAKFFRGENRKDSVGIMEAISRAKGDLPDNDALAFIWKEHGREMSIIKDAIDKRIASAEFAWAWGELCRGWSVYHFIVATQDEMERQFETGMKGTKSDKTLQKYWYAHFMRSRGVLKRTKIDRSSDAKDLAYVCEMIANGQFLVPRNPEIYTREWFEVMIKPAKDPKEGKILLKTYTDISNEEIARMTANPEIVKGMLPPLNDEEFPLVIPPLRVRSGSS